MHGSGFEELADVGKYAGFANVEILDKGILPSGKGKAFPKPELFYLIQDNSPINTSSVEQAWFRQHPEITLRHAHPNRQI